MNIHLSNTTHALELETSVAGSIHYYAGYVDITSSTVSNPADNQGVITSATTTTIVAAPSFGNTRKVQHVSVYNNGATNTIKIKKDISGTDYVIISVSLQNGETLRIENDSICTLDIAGRVKQQNVVEYGGDQKSLLKIGTAPEAAGLFYFHGKDPGFPGAWAPGTPGLNGRNTDGTTSTDAGSLNIGNAVNGAWYLRDLDMGATVAGQFNLFDVLWVNSGLAVTTTTAQSITQPTLPPRDGNGTTNGVGIQAGLLVTAATTNGAIISNTTMSYTNSDGTSGRTATLMQFPATAVVGTFVPFMLAAGDRGVRSIQSVTLGTSYVTGSLSVICYNALVSTGLILANAGSGPFFKHLDLRLYDGHCLLPFWIATSTTLVTINGNVYFINK